MDGWMDGCVVGWMVGWLVGWIDDCMEEEGGGREREGERETASYLCFGEQIKMVVNKHNRRT